MPKLVISPLTRVSNSLGSVVSGWTKNTQTPDLKKKQKKII